MYCPECGGEYRQGIAVCPVCEVHLVPESELPGNDAPLPDTASSAIVFRTPDLSMLMLARSLLDGAGIPYSIRNERQLGLFPFAGAGPTLSSAHREAEVEVPGARAEEARLLLARLQDVDPEDIGFDAGELEDVEFDDAETDFDDDEEPIDV